MFLFERCAQVMERRKISRSALVAYESRPMRRADFTSDRGACVSNYVKNRRDVTASILFFYCEIQDLLYLFF